MRRLTNLFAVAHAFEVAPRFPLGEIREDFAVKKSGNDFHRKVLFISLLGSRWFCRQRASHYAFSPSRSRAACASAVVMIRPPFTFAYRIDANASLSQT
jgi:hypothetical protein